MLSNLFFFCMADFTVSFFCLLSINSLLNYFVNSFGFWYLVLGVRKLCQKVLTT